MTSPPSLPHTRPMDKAALAADVLAKRGLAPREDPIKARKRATALENIAKANEANKARGYAKPPAAKDAKPETSTEPAQTAPGVSTRPRRHKRAPDVYTREGRLAALAEIAESYWAQKPEDRARTPEVTRAITELMALHNDAQAVSRDADKPEPARVCAWLTRCALDGRSVIDALRADGASLDAIAAHVRASLGVDRLVLHVGASVGQSPKPRAGTPPVVVESGNGAASAVETPHHNG